MRSLAKSKYFEDGEGLEELMGLISILVDFCCELQPIDMNNYDQGDLEDNFVIVSANMDTFIRVCNDYAVINGRLDSRIEWGEMTPNSVKLLIDRTYDSFEKETDFYMKVRRLLDLFKMALVLMGLIYGNKMV